MSNRWVVGLLLLTGCRSDQEVRLGQTYACFDGMNDICELYGCSTEEYHWGAALCKRRFKTDDPTLWSCNCV